MKPRKRLIKTAKSILLIIVTILLYEGAQCTYQKAIDCYYNDCHHAEFR